MGRGATGPQTYPGIEGAEHFMNDWIKGYGDPDEALRALGLG